MSITRDDVKKVALLSRLQFSEDQLDQMTDQMGAILQYVQQLSEINTDDVQPMSHALDISNHLVDDLPEESFPRETMLSNSPNSDGECYKVPAVLGDG